MYIGGGTPSIASIPIKIKSLLDNAGVYLEKCREFTIEANPCDISDDFLANVKDAGITRISLGVQSFDDRVIDNVNRSKNKIKVVGEALKKLESSPFRISIDLIAGLPGSNADFESKQLDSLLSRFNSITHCSIYSLSVEQGSTLHEKNYIIDDSKIDHAFEIEKSLRDVLFRYGFHQYEVSNYAREGHVSLHNMAYWKYKDYLGFGPSAHSTVDKRRIENRQSIAAYIQNKNYKDILALDFLEQVKEALLMGLRLTSGIHLESFYKRFTVNLVSTCIHSLEKHNKLGNITIKGGYLVTTPNGMNFLNSILSDCFIDLDQLE
jgi:oxygen-independent coproporphyrinogen-3 oxidase